MVDRTSQRGRAEATRRGWSLLSLIGALGIGAMVLGVCVPFYLASHRLVERKAGQARAREVARELTSRIRQDVRGAGNVLVTGGGSGLNLETPGSRRGVRYAWASGRLVREVRSARGELRERMVYAKPLKTIRFQRTGSAVVAVLEFAAPEAGQGKPLRVETTAAPRVEP